MIKTLIKLGLKENSYYYIEWWKTESFPPRLGIKWGCPLSAMLFKIVLEVLATAIKQKKKQRKGIHNGKEEIKLFLFVDDVILYIDKSPKNPEGSYQS